LACFRSDQVQTLSSAHPKVNQQTGGQRSTSNPSYD
jgi:hypothetical protein